MPSGNKPLPGPMLILVCSAICDPGLYRHMPGLCQNALTHWGRVTHICVSEVTIIGSDNDLSPDRRQAIIWTNVGILLIVPLGTNFGEFLIGNIFIQENPLQNVVGEMASILSRPRCVKSSGKTHKVYKVVTMFYNAILHLELVSPTTQ